MRKTCSAFTLVEVVVVLVVIGLLTALAAMTLTGTRQVLSADRLQQTLMDFDQRVRHRAWLSGERRLVVLDLDRAAWQEGSVAGAKTQPLRWSRDVNDAGIAEAWTPETGWVRSGQVSWWCSAEGEAETYALRLRMGERGDTRSDSPTLDTWLVVGVSGQWQALDEEGGSGDWILDELEAGAAGS